MYINFSAINIYFTDILNLRE